jgi:ABC-type uncharacterized transport system substrate-binding protein
MVEHKLLPYSSGLEDFLATVARPTQPRAAVYLSVNLSHALHADLRSTARTAFSGSAMCPYRDYVEDGALMAFAVDLAELLRRMADDVHQILKGAKPGDIPIYQPIKFELLINLKTAKALGLTLPHALLARAPEIIE